ncbi:DinB family protein [Metabacillus idriensis]|uniref:DinB family protein n=1 Tax=Metabacillus idriensis TaxID=324768 RepID=UPI0028149334|nr:DinB family protein [Metabacillus idriensis]MDR0136562.1 DinB family protein [Metabacillus idriensis]
MEQTIMQHMEIVRGITENTLSRIPEERADIIPAGYNNNIRWNFGHIACIQEKLVFELSGAESGVPRNYKELFSAGTKPSDWKGTPPSFAEISEVLNHQKDRLKEYIPGHFHQKLKEPFTNRAGITFHTVGETFLFSFYHEAMHIETIKRIYRAVKS